jgi:predicted permease
MLATVIVTLALGIGANTAVFSIIDAVLLRPLAVVDSKRLVAVYTGSPEWPYGGSSLETVQALTARATTLSGVAGYWTTSLELTERGPDEGAVQDVVATLVTGNYFTVLGVHASVGRTILPSDPEGAGASPVVVLSGRFWRRRYGGDPTVVGRQILLRGQSLTVIGVMPDRFRGTDLTAVPDVWIPVSMVPRLRFEMLQRGAEVNRAIPVFAVFGRLRGEVAFERAATEIDLIARQTASTPSVAPPGSAASRITVLRLEDAAAAVRDRGTLLRFLRILVAVAGLSLLLACMNVANLLVVRARERSQEIGVRLALGASASRLVRQLLAESVVLALAGGVVGVAVAVLTMRVFSAYTLPGSINLERLDLHLNLRVLVFTCGMSLLTALAFGLTPALRAARTNVVDIIRERPSAGPGGRRRAVLIAAQVAISLVLSVNAGLLIRSVRAGLDTSIGFDPGGIAALTMAPQLDGKYADVVRENEAVVDALEQDPAIPAAAAATHVPLSRYGTRLFGAGPDAEGSGGTSSLGSVLVGVNHVSERYFDVLGIPILQGRAFTKQDRPGAQRVAILNESAARALWPGESPIGKLVHGQWFGPLSFTYVVVGVVHDTKYAGLQDSRVPFVYVPLAQEEAPGAAITLIARGRSAAAGPAVLSTMRRTSAAVSPALKVGSNTSGPAARMVSDQIVALLAPQRLGAALLSGFALLALCVSAVGIYGTVAFSVSRRTTEIGIRMALGARAVNVLGVVLIDTGVAVAVGAAAGLLGACLTAALLRRLLFGVGPFDPVSFAAGLLVTVLMAMVAAVAPSWRSLRIDPVRAIRTSG